MKCRRLMHVNVRVDRLAEAVRFYQDILGLEPVPRGESGNRGAWFRLGDAEIHLAEDFTSQPPSRRHFAVEVDDVGEARRELTAVGVTIEEEEKDRFWVRDPAGNRIEFVPCASKP